MAYTTIVTKDEGAVIIADNIDTKRNKAEHKIIQLSKEAKIYLVSFGKYELDGLVWDSLIKGFQMRVNQPIATFKECTLRFEEYLRSLKDNYRKDFYIQRIIWTVLNNLTLNGGIQSLVENINRIYNTLSIDRQVNEEITPILINELVNFLNQNQISIDQESFNELVEIVKDAYLYPRKNLQDYMGICLVGVGNDETSISATSYRLYGVTENNKLLASVQQIGKGIINLEKSEATEIMIGGISQTFMDDFYWNLNNSNNPNLLQATSSLSEIAQNEYNISQEILRNKSLDDISDFLFNVYGIHRQLEIAQVGEDLQANKVKLVKFSLLDEPTVIEKELGGEQLMEKMTEKQRIFCSIYPYTTKYIEAFNNEYSDNNLRDEVIDYLNKVIHKFSNSSVSQSIDINICLVSNGKEQSEVFLDILYKLIKVLNPSFGDKTYIMPDQYEYLESVENNAFIIIQDAKSAFGGDLPEDRRGYKVDYKNYIMGILERADSQKIILLEDTEENISYMNSLEEVKNNLTNYFVIRDLTVEEAITYGKSLLYNQGLSLEDDILYGNVLKSYVQKSKHLTKRVVERFNKKILNSFAKNSRMSNVIDKKSILDATSVYNPKLVKQILDELDSLQGLDNVKQQIHEICEAVEVSQANIGNMELSRRHHMIFEGPPGTGKTTVARIVARLFYALGILENTTVIETKRNELEGKWVGDLSGKINEKVDSALGGVLFIDEAHQLYNKEDPYDKGKQVIQAFVPRLENDGEKFIAIIAGYTKEMEEFLKFDPGLASRFQHKIIFESYKPQVVAQIVVNILKKNKIEFNEKYVKAVAINLYDQIPDDKKSNARWARNYAQKLIEKQLSYCAKHPQFPRNRLFNEVLRDSVNWQIGG